MKCCPWTSGQEAAQFLRASGSTVLPLDERTGAALERYATMRGKAEGTRSLFLSTAGTPMRSRQVQAAMSPAAGRAGIEAYHGTHGLRRMVATNMANAGIDAKTIADVLGHERVDTTMGYVKVSTENLRRAAAPWPGEGLR